MTRYIAAIPARPRLLPMARKVASDPLYRGSLVMLTNTALLSALGFAFWTLAARTYPAVSVGSFSGLTAGVSLLVTCRSPDTGRLTPAARLAAGQWMRRQLVSDRSLSRRR